MFHLLDRGHEERHVPQGKAIGKGLSGFWLDGRVPIDYAVAAVADARRCGHQPAPVNGVPHVVGANALPGLRADPVFIRRKGNERTRRLLFPFIGEGARKSQFERVVSDIGQALIAESVHPGLVAKFFQQLRSPA